MKHYLPDWKHSLLLLLAFCLGLVPAAVLTFLGININSLTYACSMMAPLIVAYLLSRRNAERGCGFVPLEEARSGKFGSMLPVFLLVMFATPFIGVLLEPISNLFPMSDFLQQLFEEMFNKSHPADLIISTAILAPLCEELLCRGIICRGELAHGRPWFAILFSALIFALLHGNFQQGVTALLIGIFMGWVYYKTHSLWCTIAIHFTNNALSVAMTFLFPDLPMTATWASIMPRGWYIALVITSVAVTAAVVYILYRNYKDDQSIISFKIRPASSGEALGRECPEE